MRGLFVGVLALFSFAGAAHAQPEITSAFDSTLEGWTSNNTPPEWRSRSGGGYLFLDNNEIGVAEISAPAKFRGNLSAYEGGTLRFDANLEEALDRYWAEGEGMNYGTVTISGPAGTVTKDLLTGQPPTNQWIGYQLLLIHDTFGIEREEWLAILANVTSITVNLEAIYGREKNGFDNFRLMGASESLRVSPNPAYLSYRSGQTGNDLPRVPVRIESGVKFEIAEVKEEGLPKLETLVWTSGPQFRHVLDIRPFPGLAIGRHNITLRVSVPGRPVTEVMVVVDVGRPDEVSLNGFDNPGFVNQEKGRFACAPANAAVTSPNGGAQITQLPGPSVPGCGSKVRVNPLTGYAFFALDPDPPGDSRIVAVAPKRRLIEAPPSVTLQAFGSNPQTVERTIPVTNTSNREVVVNASIDSVARFSLVGSGAFLIPAKSTIQIPIRCDPGSFDGDFSTTLRLFEGNQQVASVLLEAQIRRFSAFPSGGSKYGLLFAPNNGGPAPPQKYGIANPTTSPVNFGVQVANSPAGGAFQVTPLEGTIPAAGTFELTVTPPSNASASARALISVYNTADPNAEPLWITAVGADYPGANQLSQRAQGACSPSELLAVFTAPGLAPPVQTGQTVGLGVQIADDCGNSLETGQVSVEFDNGDAAVELYAAGDGQWNGAWRPRNVEHGSVTLKALAFSADGSLFGFETLTLEIAAGTDPPPLFESRSITNAASQLPNLPLAGAEIISIYGQALASSEAGASTLPLPVTLGGASVSLEGEPLPLLYAGPSQINAIVPHGLPEGEPLSLTVRRGDALSFPAQVVLTTAVPGVFTPSQTGTGQGIITDVNYEILNTGNPAGAGEPIILFLAGLGAADPPVPAGQGGAVQPLSHVKADFSVTVGGVQAEVLYAVLAPGFAGLYQAAARVPQGVSPGNAVPVVVTADGISSPPVTIAVK